MQGKYVRVEYKKEDIYIIEPTNQLLSTIATNIAKQYVQADFDTAQILATTDHNGITHIAIPVKNNRAITVLVQSSLVYNKTIELIQKALTNKGATIIDKNSNRITARIGTDPNTTLTLAEVLDLANRTNFSSQFKTTILEHVTVKTLDQEIEKLLNTGEKP